VGRGLSAWRAAVVVSHGAVWGSLRDDADDANDADDEPE
jgi:hypothetical protein